MAKKNKSRKGSISIKGRSSRKSSKSRSRKNSSMSSKSSLASVVAKKHSQSKTKEPKNRETERLKKPKSETTKDRRQKTNWFQKHIRLIKTIIFFSTLIGVSIWLFWGIPLPTKLTSKQVPVSTKIFDRNGALIYEIYADKRSTPYSLDELPEYVKDATISIEDKDFYKHYGVSFTGIIRALYKNIFKGDLEGGSTLTQQLVKNALLTPERTIKRKIREFALTMVVETIYSKDKILELYLNQIPYGGTAYGIGAASELYFGKSAKDLTLSEATLLAGLPAAPSRFSPFGSHPELAKERQDLVLKRMIEDGYITKEEAEKAKEEPLKYASGEEFKAPHFALWVKELLTEKYGVQTVEKGGLRVTTTLDLDLQDFAQQAVATEVAKLKKYDVGNGAALVTLPSTGEILAMVGSKDYYAEDEDGKVNIIFANRQPGSSIKPLNYALGIRDGKITASTPLADVPTCFTIFGQAAYCPKNYDGGFHGLVQVRYALANSYNIPAVRVLALNGIVNFIDFAKTLGITTFTDPANYGLSLTLGGGEVMPFDMATAFGVLANQGVKEPLMAITKVENWKGEVLEEHNPSDVKLTGDRVLPNSVTFIISDILKDNGARTAAFGPSSFLNVKGHPEVSVKTGTTNERRDNWTIGYTKDILTLSWVGNNDNSSMSGAVSGVSGASPIWNTIIKYALDEAEEGKFDKNADGLRLGKASGSESHGAATQPQDVTGANVCMPSGNLPDNPDDPGCSQRFEYFLKSYVGARIATGSKDIQVFKDTGQLANSEALPEQVDTQNHPFLLDPLGTLVCLDCPTASSSATISYPLPISNQTDTDQ